MSNNELGVYVMKVAAMLTNMHPQTLRKYERAGFLTPSRHYMVRMYSDEDIERLKIIKHLVDNEGLNLAGVELALKLRDKLLNMKNEIAIAEMDCELKEHLDSIIDEMLEILGNYRQE